MNKRERETIRNRQRELERKVEERSSPYLLARLFEVKYLSTVLGLYSEKESSE